ncbi:MAG: ABC transporter substrate-binding protein [Pseudomonadota bacterium]
MLASNFCRALLSLLLLSGYASASYAATNGPLPVVRIAALQYGTANWELELARKLKLDEQNGFTVQIVPRVSPNASLIALQAGAADFTVSDWLWVAKQREAGRNYYFFPYSTAIAELLVPGDSAVSGIADLRDRTIGVAGGAEDKAWLLLQHYAQVTLQMPLERISRPKYGAPPLLSALAKDGQLDAVLTYWHYAARLKADGFRQVISPEQVLSSVGLSPDVPILGWVFSKTYANQSPKLVNAFLQASFQAKRRLLTDDSAWKSVRSLMNVASEEEFRLLRASYRKGIPRSFGPEDRRNIGEVAKVVRQRLQQQQSVNRGGGSNPEADSLTEESIFWLGFNLDGID